MLSEKNEKKKKFNKIFVIWNDFIDWYLLLKLNQIYIILIKK